MPDFDQVCRRIFSDSHSVLKLLFGGVLIMIPIAHFLAFGYLAKMVRLIRAGEPIHLPEWEDWSELFINGVFFFILFAIFGGGLFLAALLASWAMRPFLNWIGYLPFIPALLAFAPLTAASWYRFSKDANWQGALDLRGLFQILRLSWTRLLIPTFAFLGFLTAGFPVFPLAFFAGGVVVFTFYFSVFHAARNSHLPFRRFVDVS